MLVHWKTCHPMDQHHLVLVEVEVVVGIVGVVQRTCRGGHWVVHPWQMWRLHWVLQKLLRRVHPMDQQIAAVDAAEVPVAVVAVEGVEMEARQPAVEEEVHQLQRHPRDHYRVEPPRVPKHSMLVVEVVDFPMDQ